MEEEAGINYVILVVVAVAILLIVIVFVGSRKVDYSQTSDDIGVASIGKSASIDVKNKVGASTQSKKGELIDVAGAVIGEASILRENNKLYLIVDADLSDPSKDRFYETWLVDENNSYYSIGALTKGSSDAYSLEFSTNDEFKGYNTIIITEEEIKDMTPEKHLLEANIQE